MPDQNVDQQEAECAADKGLRAAMKMAAILALALPTMSDVMATYSGHLMTAHHMDKKAAMIVAVRLLRDVLHELGDEYLAKVEAAR